MNKTVIFVDAGYLLANSDRKNRKIDLVKLSKILAKETWIKTIFYDALPKLGTPKYSKRQRFHSSLRKLDKIEVRLGRLQYDKNGKPTQKGVDMKIGVDLVQMSMKKRFWHCNTKFLQIVIFNMQQKKAQEVKCKKSKLAYFPGSSIIKTFRNTFDGIELLHDRLLDKCKNVIKI